jgi:hypothetical protein
MFFLTPIITHQGRVLTAIPTTSNPSHPIKGPVPGVTGRPEPLAASSVVFMLGVDGQGVGDELDMLLFINADNKDDTGCIKYGDTVALKSLAGKERYSNCINVNCWHECIIMSLCGSMQFPGVEGRDSSGLLAPFLGPGREVDAAHGLGERT